MFVLSNPSGKLLALHAKGPGWSRDTAARHLREATENARNSGWWVGEDRIYWVFLRPISAGAGTEQRDLGFLVVGYELGAGLAQELARESRSSIVFATESRILASTLPVAKTAALQHELGRNPKINTGDRGLVDLDGSRYSAASFQLTDETTSPIRCFVLSSQQSASDFLMRLNRVLLGCAVLSILLAAVLVQVISRAVTRPLEAVVAGIEALAHGDYRYSVAASGSLEVERLAASFSAMRGRLLESQRNMLAAERAAVLDLTASSISHDLRHFLSAVVANAEFLYDSELTRSERSDVYHEIKLATDQMLDLIESMRELAREHPALNLASGRLDETIERSVGLVEGRQQFQSFHVDLTRHGDMDGNFDSRKLERAFFNLLLNAAEAAGEDRDPRVRVEIASEDDAFLVRIKDNGHGIPAELTDQIFDPFVSFGKHNGTGLGLAIADKIIREHGGSLRVEQSSSEGTTLLASFPRHTKAQLAATTHV
ncbi:MAG: hypothetical protein NVS9B15_18070 [Acidobacteriaceae bacterium]